MPTNTCTSGCGAVFRLDTTGTETVLYSFTGGADGFGPGGLIRDSAGNLYGTAGGGASGYGLVFKLDTTGTETVLYSFTGGGDGGGPFDLIRDAAGNLYGTAGSASGYGLVFKLDTTGTETVLYSFTGGTDGGLPSGLVRDAAGNFYGTTYRGGVETQTCGGGVALFPCGVVFKLDTTGTETVLHSFTGEDGYVPSGLIRDPAGNLYGTTIGFPYGEVFKVDTTGKFTALYSFTGGADGHSPLVWSETRQAISTALLPTAETNSISVRTAI